MIKDLLVKLHGQAMMVSFKERVIVLIFCQIDNKLISPQSPPINQIYHDTDNDIFYKWNGSKWVETKWCKR
jgi:hypothetical protein